MNCPSCNAPVLPGAAFCDNCGVNLAQFAQAPAQGAAPGSTKCPGCGAENVPGSLYCDNCGAALNQPAQRSQTEYAPVQPAQPPQQQWNAPVQPAPAPAAPQRQQPPAPGAPGASVPQPVSIPGRFVVQASNVSLPIPAGKAEIIVGREDPVSGIFPDVDLDAYDALNQGVSRSHARLTMQGGQVYIEDLKTANYTNLRGQRLNPGQKYPLNHGDELVLGRLRLVYYAS